jgi:DNA-directed RNA polymerase specialized sigma24 family protein
MAGDEVAVTEFAGVFGPRLFGFYVKRTRGRVADAEEIANTCLHNVISAVRNGKYTRVPEASFEAFLFTIARNILSDWWEDQRPSFNERPFDETSEVEPEPLMPNMEIVAAIDDAMMFLAGPDEEIISSHRSRIALTFYGWYRCVGHGREKPRGAMPGSVTGSLGWFWISPKRAFAALISDVEAIA